jgi:hypothetical protein
MKSGLKVMKKSLLNICERRALGVIALFVFGMSAAAAVQLIEISSDPFTNRRAQHRTEVEPDTFNFGNTIVSAFQTGRVMDGGSSDIGWATSNDGGRTWNHGFLPGITSATEPGARYGRVSDPAVAYDAEHDTWLIASLGIRSALPFRTDVLVSRSTDRAQTWSTPTEIRHGIFPDKNWIVCDNSPTSVYRGTCYVQYDEVTKSNQMRMQVSTDGGVTWSRLHRPKGLPSGLGGQPVVQPDGTVVVPYLSTSGQIQAFVSRDGGTHWSASATIGRVYIQRIDSGLRVLPLPSAEIDGAGRVYVVWYDCRYRSGCASHDIVMSSSINGVDWSPAGRIPIDRRDSVVDHFIPGLGVDPTSSGSTARLALTYFYYPNAQCTYVTCRLRIGFVSSVNGGATWSKPLKLTGPMQLAWLPNTTSGRMVGDYISTSVLPGGNAIPLLPLASRTTPDGYNMAMSVPVDGLPLSGGPRPLEF